MLITKTVGELLTNENDMKLLDSVSSSFQSPNPDIHSFIHEKVVQATRLKTSVTHLVFQIDSGKLDFVGFFTLAIKVIRIKSESLSSRERNLIKSFSYFDSENRCFNCPAILIAQFGRNFNADSDSISGADLMSLSLQKIAEAQKILGGKVVFLECEPIEKLIAFYQNQGFKLLDDSVLSRNDKELRQMYMIL